MADPKSDAVSPVGNAITRGQAPAPVGADFKAQGRPSSVGGGLPPQDTLEISQAARAADDLHFSYDAETQTLQTQVVDPKTGKSVMEFPSDEQIRLQASLRKIMKGREASGNASSGAA